jgi:hypothetical protein
MTPGKPAAGGDQFDAADRASFWRGRARSIFSPPPGILTCARQFREFASALAAELRRVTTGGRRPRAERYSCRIAPVRAVISADSSARTMPSLSVVHTAPSNRLKDARASAGESESVKDPRQTI